MKVTIEYCLLKLFQKCHLYVYMLGACNYVYTKS